MRIVPATCMYKHAYKQFPFVSPQSFSTDYDLGNLGESDSLYLEGQLKELQLLSYEFLMGLLWEILLLSISLAAAWNSFLLDFSASLDDVY